MPVEPDPSASAAPEPAPEPVPAMSVRSMLLLGGAMSLGVALVLGLTLLVGVHGTSRASRSDAPGTVPSLAGRGLPEATSALASRKLAIGAILQVPSSLPAGEVVRTAPAAGQPVAEGSSVTVYVSAGSGGGAGPGSKVTVPYLLGVDARQARQVAQNLGLRLEPAEGEGRVTAQRPEPGTEVVQGSTVTVTLG